MFTCQSPCSLHYYLSSLCTLHDISYLQNYGWSPLYAAADMGYDSVVALLLSNGADVNQTDKNGYSPLVHTDRSIALVSTNDVLFLSISILTLLTPNFLSYVA